MKSPPFFVVENLFERIDLSKGYSAENLKLMRRFYVAYSKDQIGETMFTQFESRKMEASGFYEEVQKQVESADL